ncbi:MAG: DUF202 domain-containing protein [Ignavibacteriaceae bacterium]|jgi:putative membrane protein
MAEINNSNVSFTIDDYKKFGPRLVILSAERTLLSWLRLALALMSLGFILDRFGIFIRLKEIGSSITWLPRSYTFLMGVCLVIAGSLTSGIAGFIYARFRIKYLRSGYAGPEGSISLTVFISALITIIGVVTAVFLITISD